AGSYSATATLRRSKQDAAYRGQRGYKQHNVDRANQVQDRDQQQAPECRARKIEQVESADVLRQSRYRERHRAAREEKRKRRRAVNPREPIIVFRPRLEGQR